MGVVDTVKSSGHEPVCSGVPARRFLPTALIGFASLICWQDMLYSSEIRISTGHPFSPLAVFDLSAVLLLIVSFSSYRKGTPTATSAPWLCLSMGIGTLAGIVGWLMEHNSCTWIVYLCAILCGLSTAMAAYIWAEHLMCLSKQHMFAITTGAMLLAGLVKALLLCTPLAVIHLALPLIALASCLCLAAGHFPVDESQPLIFRPVQVRDYVKLAIGVTVLAAALGTVVGTTAEIEIYISDSMQELERLTAYVTVVCSGALIIIWFVSKGRFGLESLMKLLPSFMLIVILLNVARSDYSDLWRACAFYGWSVIMLLIMLFVVEVSRKNIVSLPLLFPPAWATLMTGHAIGVVFSQTLFVAAIGVPNAGINLIVANAILVVCASFFILSNRLMLGFMVENTSLGSSLTKPATLSADSANQPTESISADKTSTEDPFEQRCHMLAQRYHLSQREEEVFILLALGNTRANIAKRLFISENTAREHAKNIYSKLSIHSKQQLIDLVDRLG